MNLIKCMSVISATGLVSFGLYSGQAFSANGDGQVKVKLLKQVSVSQIKPIELGTLPVSQDYTCVLDQRINITGAASAAGSGAPSSSNAGAGNTRYTPVFNVNGGDLTSGSEGLDLCGLSDYTDVYTNFGVIEIRGTASLPISISLASGTDATGSVEFTPTATFQKAGLVEDVSGTDQLRTHFDIPTADDQNAFFADNFVDLGTGINAPITLSSTNDPSYLRVGGTLKNLKTLAPNEAYEVEYTVTLVY